MATNVIHNIVNIIMEIMTFKIILLILTFGIFIECHISLKLVIRRHPSQKKVQFLRLLNFEVCDDVWFD